MKLYIQSNDDLIRSEFNKKTTLTTLDQADVVFIDLQSKISMKFFESATKSKKRFIVFDRNLSINVNDTNTLRKQGVILTEPALNFRRKYFNYIPHWVKTKNINEIELNKEDKYCDLVFKGRIQDKTDSFNKYYLSYANTYPNTVTVDDTTYNNRGVIKNDKISYNECKATVIIGSPEDYTIGYLDNSFFEALNNNCIPLIVPENKYFSMLAPYKINNTFDINYVVANYGLSYIGYLLGIYKTIEDYYPEMIVENVVSDLIELVK